MTLLNGSVTQAERLAMWIAGEGGIYRVEMDNASGQLGRPELAAEFVSGSWLVTHPQHRLLYASFKDGKAGGVAVFRYDATGGLEAWERKVLPSGSPTHIALDPSGGLLATAHYGAGAVDLLGLRADGGFADGEAFVLALPFRGQGPKPIQSQARPHFAMFSADGRRLHVPDLGNDFVWTLAVDAGAKTLAVESKVELPRGAGPRHRAAHPTLPTAYVTGELGSIVALLQRDEAGAWAVREVRPSLSPGDDAPSNDTSEIRVHPSGRWLYVGNRGHDSIGVFAIDPVNGALTPVEREPVRGSWPRNFDFDPSGGWLVAAGQNSGTLSSFAIDEETGALRFSLSVVHVPQPVRVLFVPPEAN